MTQVDTSRLQVRTKEQLLADFAGVGEPQLKLLNLIWTLFKLLEAEGVEIPDWLPESAGTAGQVLKVAEDGSVTWAGDADTTYGLMTVADATNGTTTSRVLSGAALPTVIAALPKIAALGEEATVADVIAALKNA